MAEPDAVRVKRSRTPKPVGLGALGLGGGDGVKVGSAYEGGVSLLFKIPKFAGYGAHWDLDDDERKELGDAVREFVKTLPKSKRKKWEKMLEKYWPGINLAVVAGMITVPRVMATVELAKMQRAAANQESLPPSDIRYGSPTNAGPRPVVTDLRDVIERHQNGPAETGPSIPAGSVGEAGHDDGSAGG